MGDKTLRDVLPSVVVVALIGAGLVSCNVANSGPAAPPEEPYGNIKAWCARMGGTYVPEPATPSHPLVGKYRHKDDMPKCLGADGKPITVPPGPGWDVEPPGPAEREWPR